MDRTQRPFASPAASGEAPLELDDAPRTSSAGAGGPMAGVPSDGPGAGRCPRDGHPLVRAAGALGEDVCPACQSRFLPTAETLRLFRDTLGVREELLHALAAEGGRKWDCPACGRKMTTTHARGVEVELCKGCGGSFLDAGELARLSGGLFREVEARGPVDAGAALGPDAGRASADPFRIEVVVHCVHCEEALDLQRVNWLLNSRPWCAGCARPHTSLVALVRSTRNRVLRALGLPLRPRSSPFSELRRYFDPHDNDPYAAPDRMDVLRVAPKDALRLFEPYFELQGSRPGRRPEPASREGGDS